MVVGFANENKDIIIAVMQPRTPKPLIEVFKAGEAQEIIKGLDVVRQMVGPEVQYEQSFLERAITDVSAHCMNSMLDMCTWIFCYEKQGQSEKAEHLACRLRAFMALMDICEEEKTEEILKGLLDYLDVSLYAQEKKKKKKKKKK